MTPPLLAAQLKVAPGVEEEPLNVTVGPVVQLITLSGPALTFGRGLTVNIFVHVLTQPLLFVTVTVYVVVVDGLTEIDRVTSPVLHK